MFKIPKFKLNWHTIQIFLLHLEDNFPQIILSRTRISREKIREFVQFAGTMVEKGAKILDAGAGPKPYQKYFSHAQYESTDFEYGEKFYGTHQHDFVCSLDKIPRPNNYYQAILCTQVLEHVPYPQLVINEFYRVLSEGGQLFLTAPQQEKLHMSPYNFFNFTKDGLELLCKNAGFEIVFVRPMGGIFVLLAYIVRNMPLYFLRQYSNPRVKYFAYIFYFVSIPFCILVFPIICFYLDKFDKSRAHTVGYACCCKK